MGGTLAVPVHPFLQIRLQELEDEVEHRLGVLLNVLDAEQPGNKKMGFFFSGGEILLFFSLFFRPMLSLSLFRNRKKKLCLLDDVVGLGEHLEQGDLAQGRRGDTLLLHLFFLVESFYSPSVKVERVRRRKKKSPPPAQSLLLLNVAFLPFPSGAFSF